MLQELKNRIGRDPETGMLTVLASVQPPERLPHQEDGKQPPALFVLEELQILIDEQGLETTLIHAAKLVRLCVQTMKGPNVSIPEKAFGFACYNMFATELKTDADLTDLGNVIAVMNQGDDTVLLQELDASRQDIFFMPIGAAAYLIGQRIDSEIKKSGESISAAARMKVYREQILPRLR